jgi:Spy/CpxP family protein refolding chaperone
MKLLSKTIVLIVLAIFMIGTLPLMAQDGPGKRIKPGDRAERFAQMKSMKIAFITEHLELTPEEAEKFWPIYNEYEKKRDEAAKEIFKRFNPDQEKPLELSDENADNMIMQRFAEEQTLLDLKKEYYAKYKEVLTASRILKLYEVENRFKRHLLERVREGSHSRSRSDMQERRKPESTPE